MYNFIIKGVNNNQLNIFNLLSRTRCYSDDTEISPLTKQLPSISCHSNQCYFSRCSHKSTYTTSCHTNQCFGEEIWGFSISEIRNSSKLSKFINTHISLIIVHILNWWIYKKNKWSFWKIKISNITHIDISKELNRVELTQKTCQKVRCRFPVGWWCMLLVSAGQPKDCQTKKNNNNNSLPRTKTYMKKIDIFQFLQFKANSICIHAQSEYSFLYYMFIYNECLCIEKYNICSNSLHFSEGTRKNNH